MSRARQKTVHTPSAVRQGDRCSISCGFLQLLWRESHFFAILRRQIDRTEDHTRSGWHSPCTDPHCVRNRRENKGAEHLLLAGVKTRGIYLAQRIAAKLGEVEGKAPPVLELDVTPWRDDVPRTDAPLPDLDPRIAGATVIIVDDVLYTGRTVRAAIEAISHRGRAERIQLAVLVDRGHRELPLRPDYIGKNLPTARDERVFVRLTEVDGEDSVNIQARNP